MVAYSFSPQFRAPILEGVKRQTLRNDRKRHARPGEQIQLYTGMRTKHCAIIGRARCADVFEMRIDFAGPSIDMGGVCIATSPFNLDSFAMQDGFADFDAMRAFWAEKHPLLLQWSGVRIAWDNFEPAKGPR